MRSARVIVAPLSRSARILFPTLVLGLYLFATSGNARAQQAAEPDPQPPPRRASISLGDSPKQVQWNERWKRFGWTDLVATTVMATTSLATLAIAPDEDRWTGPNDFDEAVRRAMRLEGLVDRDRARDASDVFLMLAINQMLVDTLVVTWWGHDSQDVAIQMVLMNIEAIAVNSALNGLVAGLVSRERPYGRDCVGELAESTDCTGNKRYRSFYSGHTSTTFTSAALTCMHHAYLPLYGGGAADKIVCATGFLMAGTTGMLRIMGDQHYLSDVLVGAAMGTASGLLVPWLLHYRTGDLPAPKARSGVRMTLLPTPTGGVLSGVF